MKIIGCDFHPGYQQIVMLDQETGELREMQLSHQQQGEAARKFYSALPLPVRVGLEASGQSQWFERLLAELGHELWIGDAAKIRASAERKQKKRIAGMPRCCCSCCWKIVFRGSGFLRRPNAMLGSCCCIVPSWCGCAHRSRTSCRRWH